MNAPFKRKFILLLTIYLFNNHVYSQLIEKCEVSYSTSERRLSKELVDVITFGVKGDGKTDDYESIKKAIDFVLTNKSIKGIKLGKGVFMISKSIYIPSDFIFQGSGKNVTILKATKSLYGLIKVASPINRSKIKNCNISNLSIDAGNFPSSSCIHLFNSEQVVIENVSCGNSTNENISIQYGTNEIQVKNSFLSGGSFCVQVYGVNNNIELPLIVEDYPRNIFIKNNNMNSSRYGAIFINGAKNIIIEGNNITGGVRGIGIGIPYRMSSSKLSNILGDFWSTENISIKKNNISNTENYGIQTYYGKNISIDSNIVTNVLGLSEDKSCLTIDRSRNVSASYNKLIGSDKVVNVVYITGAHRAVCSNNIISKGAYGIQVAANWESGEDTTINESSSIKILQNKISSTSIASIISNGSRNLEIHRNNISESNFGFIIMGSRRSRDNKQMISDSLEISNNIILKSINTPFSVLENVLNTQISCDLFDIEIIKKNDKEISLSIQNMTSAINQNKIPKYYNNFKKKKNFEILFGNDAKNSIRMILKMKKLEMYSEKGKLIYSNNVGISKFSSANQTPKSSMSMEEKLIKDYININQGNAIEVRRNGGEWLKLNSD